MDMEGRHFSNFLSKNNLLYMTESTTRGVTKWNSIVTVQEYLEVLRTIKGPCFILEVGAGQTAYKEAASLLEHHLWK